MNGPAKGVFERLRRSAGRGSPVDPAGGGGGRRKPQRGTPPDAVGRGPLASAPGFGIGIVVPVRDEAPYLEEWLAYHRALGVGHVVIYDNGSTDDFHGVVDRWVDHGLVTVVHWPLPGGQIDAYSHALRFFGAAFEWLAFIDVDEFIVPLEDDDLPSLLARWPDAADVRIPRIDFGYSGHRTPPDGLTIEAYTEVADVFRRDPAKPPRVKSIVRPRGVSAMGIHTATLAEPGAGAAEEVPRDSVGRRSGELVQVNHYYTRSFEEFEAKRVRGSATGRIERPAVPFDLPVIRVDTSAHRFIEPTRAIIERMRSLAPSPYHYGSQLELSQFPHFNDLGLFGEFLVANVVAGEPEPRREPAKRLENLHTGVGFVGDVAHDEFDPLPAALSGSIHLDPLLARTRGRVDGSLAGTGAASTAGFSDDSGVRRLDGGRARASFAIAAEGERRCYAIGFLVSTAGATVLSARVVGPDGEAAVGGGPIELPAAGLRAGIVEIDATPRLVEEVIVDLAADEPGATVYDLFVVSYG